MIFYLSYLFIAPHRHSARQACTGFAAESFELLQLYLFLPFSVKQSHSIFTFFIAFLEMVFLIKQMKTARGR